MALILDSARFLLSSRRRGVSFESTVTFGRQEFYLTPWEVRRVLRENDLDPSAFPDLFPGVYPSFAEPFWKALGARRHETLDASPYEGATLVHDLNRPIPAAWREQFTVVCDAGTLEHVFDFPQALRNGLELVKPGGHFLGITPANNHFGHGLYQFSPELFFRALAVGNGFELERMYALEFGWRHRWFEVTNPAVARSRVTLMSRYPVMLFYQARKIATVPLFEQPPQQSDYLGRWTEPAASAQPTATLLPGIRRSWQYRLLTLAPRLCRALEYVVHTRLNPAFSFRNRRAFRRVDPRRL